jgi:hypothetical protein
VVFSLYKRNINPHPQLLRQAQDRLGGGEETDKQ